MCVIYSKEQMDTIRRYASSLGFGSVVAAFNDRDVIATIRQVLEWHQGMSDADLLARVRGLARDYAFDIAAVSKQDNQRVLDLVQGRREP